MSSCASHCHTFTTSTTKQGAAEEILSRGKVSATFFVRAGSQLPFKSHETNTIQIHAEKHRKNKNFICKMTEHLPREAESVPVHVHPHFCAAQPRHLYAGMC